MKLLKVILFLVAISFSSYSQDNRKFLSFEPIWVVKDTSGNYKIYSDQGKTWKLYEGKSASAINWKKSIGTVNGQPVAVKSKKTERKYFAAVNNSDTLIVSERHIPMNGTPNLRDIGGMPTATGRSLKWGVIYRSGSINNLNESDLTIFKNLGIKDVVDFRNDSEIQQAPDKYPANYQVNRIRAQIGISNEKNAGQTSQFYELMKSDTATEEDGKNLLIAANKNMAANVKDYKPMFDELIENKGQEGLLFHCSAGKDRTGLASALILSALGVPEEAIMQEYTLTNNYFTASALNNPRLKDANPAVIKAVMSAQPEFLQAALDKIKSEYGSIEACLEKEVGLTEAKRKLLIDSYTY